MLFCKLLGCALLVLAGAAAGGKRAEATAQRARYLAAMGVFLGEVDAALQYSPQPTAHLLAQAQQSAGLALDVYKRQELYEPISARDTHTEECCDLCAAFIVSGIFYRADPVDAVEQPAAAGKPHADRLSIYLESVSYTHLDVYKRQGHAGDLANEIQARTGIDSRATVLGHVQRGGSPSLRDRVTASRMGYHAVELINKGIYNRVVATRAESIVDYDISVCLLYTSRCV